MKENELKQRLQSALEGSDEAFLPPELLAEWEPTECLGGDGSTLLVRSRKDGTLAVAKSVGSDKTDSNVWNVLFGLKHPSLPAFIARYEYDGRLFIIREYIEGKALSDASNGGDYTAHRTAELGIKLCDVLGYLHSQTPPVIHRDVKPENILLRPDGGVALIDFGIARTYDKGAGQDTRVMGTERFAPPEQYGFSQTDNRSDLYALGIVLNWLMTGSVKREDAEKIGEQGLRNVILKCTSFSPKERYASAAELKAALTRCLRPKRRAWLFAVPVLAAIVAAVLLLTGQGQNRAVEFADPVIEQAVRQTLGKGESDALTEEELASVEGLYIFGDAVARDQDGFYRAAGNWYASGSKAHGAVTTLEDVRYLPNLKNVMVAAQHITDLTPLKGLTSLEKVEFKHNSISDVTPLSDMEALCSVGLNDNPVSDLTALTTLKNLRFLDLCDASSYDPSFMDGLGDMEFLDISNRTDSWKRIGSRAVRELKLGWTGIDSLDALSGVTGLERLELQHTAVTSLEGIEVHQGLTFLRLSGCELTDLSPLAGLANLAQVTVDAAQAALLEGMTGINFEVTIEE